MKLPLALLPLLRTPRMAMFLVLDPRSLAVGASWDADATQVQVFLSPLPLVYLALTFTRPRPSTSPGSRSKG